MIGKNLSVPDDSMYAQCRKTDMPTLAPKDLVWFLGSLSWGLPFKLILPAQLVTWIMSARIVKTINSGFRNRTATLLEPVLDDYDTGKLMGEIIE